ncbi:TAXI family TRAP transporter solute-binding subunit [Reyranella massiliensis]|uniref:TAXI family TRAP transporter solute-binding subunit n=1 Tax=Reyranella massiliensis TaxID=445220 RepID=UPI0005BD0DDC|nr:TAXI family TRAP transporter solute-binding subunit [Reyranella massiliensis]
MAYGLRSVAVAAAIAMACIGSAAAQDVKLPGTLTVTAYETGSNAFNQAVAVGQMLKNKYGTDLRVLPAGNDVARLGPLRAGRAQASAMGVGIYYAQEGVLEFATKEWGPQSLQLLLSATTCSGQALGIAKDLGVSQVKDLKGRRMGWVVGSPAINQSLLGLIAFGGLTKADVKVVDYSSYGAMMKGLVNNEVDIIFASTISGQAKEAENSPRGIMWPPMPPSDTAGWERVQKLAPYFYPHKSTCGAGYAKGETIEVAVYPYPIFMAYASQPAELVHALTKAMIANYDSYKDAVVGVDGLEAKRQNQKWIVPYHPGAVRALKEAGVWTEEGQKNNDTLIARQKVLAEAWAAYLKTNPPDDKDAFRKGWMEARRTALTKAGQPVGFDE